MSLRAHVVASWQAGEVAAVLGAFGLGDPVSQPRLFSDRWDAQRSACSVETLQGPFFLKKHHESVVRPETHAAVRAFIEAGGAAVAPLDQWSGETWHRSPDGWWAEVAPLLPATPPQASDDALALQAAEQVAILHGLPPDCVPRDGADWFDADEALARFGSGEASAALGGWLDRTPAGLPEAVTHGDLWLGNWLVADGGIAALTDFDWVSKGERLDDLCDVIMAFCSTRDTGRREFDVLWERAEAMLATWERRCGDLTAGERDLLPARIAHAWARHAVWTLQADEEVVYSVDCVRHASAIAEQFSATADRIASGARSLISARYGRHDSMQRGRASA